MKNSSDQSRIPSSQPEELEVEKLIQCLPLKSPSTSCDDAVLSMLKDKSSTSVEASHLAIPPTKKSTAGMAVSILSTAAALLIGFLLGSLVNRQAPNNSAKVSNKELNQASAGFELSDNVQVVEGKSRTLIVEDRIQMQNNVPVRKLETVTHKKVRVRGSEDQSEKEIEIPIRKVFFTLAESI